MHKQRSKMISILEQLLPVFLALVCILVMTVSTHQAMLAIPLPLNFAGEYSFDNGENWQALTDNSDLSTDQGDLWLRGNFDCECYPGGVLYLYQDHVGVTLNINGEPMYLSEQSEILSMGEAGKKYFPDVCYSNWTLIALENGWGNSDQIEIHLQKMHDYIDRDAYRSFLKSCYIGPIDTTILESYLQPHVIYWVVLGCLFLIMAVMMLGATIAASALQTGIVKDLSKLGFLLLFAGGYFVLDTITVSFWSEKMVFNTYARQICMMMTVYWMGLCIRDRLTDWRLKIGRIVMAASLVLNAALILPSFMGAWPIFSTTPVWAVGQIVFALVMIGAVIGEMPKSKKRLSLCMYILLLTTLLLDIAGVGSSMYSHGTCTKIAFTLFFVVYGCRAIKRVMVDYQGARRAKKLEKEVEESRIAIMLSQMQPHFIYNILNVIYYLCGKDSTAAQAAISKFSDHLRNNMEALSQKELISFQKELDHIHTYLELEQIRFGEELSVVFDIEEDGFVLPVLSIQPLVENAVKHGIAKKRGGGIVTISSCQTETAYRITVTDNGVGFDVDRYMEDGKVHVGLINVRQRLFSQMQATMDITSVPGEGTTVTVTIPKKKVTT